MVHLTMDMPFYLMSLYGSIMIIIVLLLRVFVRNKLPKFAFPALWCMVVLRLLIPFSISSPISAPVPQWQYVFAEREEQYALADNKDQYLRGISNEWNIVSETVVTNFDTGGTIMEGVGSVRDFYYMPDPRLLLYAFIGMGAAVTAAVLLLQKYRCTHQLKGSLLLEHNEVINHVLHEISADHVPVYSNDEIASPMVWGIFNPRIYLPTGMDFQNKELLKHILLHEAAHIRRKDNLLKAVMSAALCLNWYNPLIWLMAKKFSSDLEAACDESVLKRTGTDLRQSYAGSLLAMAIAGSKSSLHYSAFSRTEVERRIRDVLSYKKMTALPLILSTLLLTGSITAFAAGVQSPFSTSLSSFCASSSCRWGVKAQLTRNISVGENKKERADNAIFKGLDYGQTNDPIIIEKNVLTALAEEFGVEKSAFQLTLSLCPDEEETDKEYADNGITVSREGFYFFRGEKIRFFTDEMLDSRQVWQEGSVDISVVRDRLGNMITVKAYHKGDSEFDQRTDGIQWNDNKATALEQ